MGMSKFTRHGIDYPPYQTDPNLYRKLGGLPKSVPCFREQHQRRNTLQTTVGKLLTLGERLNDFEWELKDQASVKRVGQWKKEIFNPKREANGMMTATVINLAGCDESQLFRIYVSSYTKFLTYIARIRRAH
jgi:hypothetical protein